MTRVFLIGSLLAIILIGGVVFLSQNNPKPALTSPTPTTVLPYSSTAQLPFTAHFLIFTNRTRRIFTDSRYHNLSPDVYINSDKPNSVVINKTGITWGEFFTTLPMKLAKDCLTTGTGQNFCSNSTATLMFYINGESDPDALDRTINPGDRLLVSYGQTEAVTDQLQQLKEIN